MINPIEFKLKANEFKILQYLKIKNEESQENMAYHLNLSIRTVRDSIQIMDKLNYIVRIRKGDDINKGYYYKVNDIKEWIL